MCSSCDDETYAAYGGAWERLDCCYGRVGSAFTPEVGARTGTHVLPEDAQPLQQAPAEEQLPPVEPRTLDGMAPQPEMEGAPQPEAMEGETAPEPPAETDTKSTDSSVLLGPIRTVR